MISSISRIFSSDFISNIGRKRSISNDLPSDDIAQIVYDTFEYSIDDRFKYASGRFTDKNFSVITHSKFQHRSLTGQIDDSKFKIIHDGQLFKSDKITGYINDKDIDLSVENGILGHCITGKIGKESVLLKYNQKVTGVEVEGFFKNKPVSFKIGDRFAGGKVHGQNIDLRMDIDSLFTDDVKIVGEYKNDPDLIPLILDFVYAKADELSVLDIMF